MAVIASKLESMSGIEEAVAEPGDVTELLRRARNGDDKAEDELLATTYGDLRKLARARLRGGGRDLMLDTTSLVNEWYVRFARTHGAQLTDRVHFMRHAAKVMRSVIVDFARRHNAASRGGGAKHESLTIQIADRSRAAVVSSSGELEILRVHETLDELAKFDARMSQIVEMRFFAGMSEADIAEALGVSGRTVRREWEKARMWLAEALE